MAHQCVKCSRIIPAGNRELLEGCAECHGHFFFYIRDEQLEEIKKNPINIPENEKTRVEKDIRELAGIIKEDAPVILDIESVRVLKPGKYELNLVDLFKGEPIVYKYGNGKYMIDLASAFGEDKI